MVVVARVVPKIFPSQFTRSPGFIERMAKQIVFGDSRVQLIEEFHSSHDCRFLRRQSIYECRQAMTTGALAFFKRFREKDGDSG